MEKEKRYPSIARETRCAEAAVVGTVLLLGTK